MNKMLLSVLAVSIFFSQTGYYGSTTAPVVIAGGIIKAKQVQPEQKKYKRKDCPVCKGKGWYISGDGIKRVDCGYCEPDTDKQPEAKSAPKTICNGDSCKTQIIRK
jgi:hypothetical protein